jgi:hypothetical protein
MSTPSPLQPESSPQPKPRQPMNLQDSTVALARLNEQMQLLTAKLEYLRLLLKLGVR